MAELDLAVGLHIEPCSRGRGDAAGIDEQLHREPLWKEQQRIVIQSGKGKGLGVDQRHAGVARPHHAMPRPASTGRQQIVE